MQTIRSSRIKILLIGLALFSIYITGQFSSYHQSLILMQKTEISNICEPINGNSFTVDRELSKEFNDANLGFIANVSISNLRSHNAPTYSDYPFDPHRHLRI